MKSMSSSAMTNPSGSRAPVETIGEAATHRCREPTGTPEEAGRSVAAVAGRVIVIGGSIAGLAAGAALARRGWTVDVIERDVAPATEAGDEAFLEWDRPGVPQFRHAHAFAARARNLLLEHLPEAVDRLVADGIEEWNLFKMLAPPEMWTDDDDAFTGLWSRRPPFELALRRLGEQQPGMALHCPAAAAGLLYDEPRDGRPVVAGVRLQDDTELRGDVVLDCGGRRTPVPGWLRADHGVEVPADELDCDSIYFTRYYRQSPESMLSQLMLIGVGGGVDQLGWLGFPGDHRTFAIGLMAPPGCTELRVLRHEWAFDAVAASIPVLAPWVDPANATPLTEPTLMAGHANVRRHPVVDGEPLALGVLLVGDSLCTTNPQYGWGASLALTYAFAAVDAVLAHHDDPRAMALAYDEVVAAEADDAYHESAANDRSRLYRQRGEAVPDWDAEAMARVELLFGVMAGSLKDPVLGRAALRRGGLLDRPGATLDDPEVVEHAQRTLAILAAKAPRRIGPDHEELLAILAAARPD
jgi:2-polyprenyl-6-methoxyphenol hydroxylase-like FAD-dependent oxidoreductase